MCDLPASLAHAIDPKSRGYDADNNNSLAEAAETPTDQYATQNVMNAASR
jgi:hypothetical protein